MGMGEPLYNLDAVAAAIDIVSDNEGIAISRRRITVSTSGVVPKLTELGERTQAMLAISLHATNDPLRDVLVPLNKRYDIAALMEAIRAYPGLSNARRVTFEYVMLKGVNDSPEEARALVRLLKGIPAKINLIPFNPWPGSDYVCSDWGAIERFAAILNKRRLRLAHPHPARPRHPRRLRPAQEREREAPRQRPPRGGCGARRLSGLRPPSGGRRSRRWSWPAPRRGAPWAPSPGRTWRAQMSGRRWRGSSCGRGLCTSLELGAGERQHLLRQLQHGELAGVAEVDRAGDVVGRVHQAHEALDQVVDVAEGARLRARRRRW